MEMICNETTSAQPPVLPLPLFFQPEKIILLLVPFSPLEFKAQAQDYSSTQIHKYNTIRTRLLIVESISAAFGTLQPSAHSPPIILPINNPAPAPAMIGIPIPLLKTE
jgi:hypothetical protein